jgi:ribosome modulation factor
MNRSFDYFYEEGFAARWNGADQSACKFREGWRRDAWLGGWRVADSRRNVPPKQVHRKDSRK